MELVNFKQDNFGCTLENQFGNSIRIPKSEYGIVEMAIFINELFICVFAGEKKSIMDNVSAFDLNGKKIWTLKSNSPGTGGPTSWVWVGDRKQYNNQIAVVDDVGWTFPIINLDTGELGEPSLNRWG